MNIAKYCHKFIRHTRYNSLRTKLFLCFLFVSVISTMLIGVLAYNYFNKINMMKYNDSTNKGVLLAISKTSAMIKEINRVSDEVFSNKFFQETLASNITNLNQEGYKIYTEADSVSKTYTVHNNNIHSVVIMDNQFQMFSYQYSSSLSDLVNTTIKPNIEKISMLKGRNLWVTPFVISNADGETRILPMARLIRHIETLKPIGYVIINIYEESIRDILKNVSSDSDNAVFIVNDSGVLLSEYNNKYFQAEDIAAILGTIGSNGAFSFNETIKNREFVINSYIVNESNWKFINAIPYSSVQRESINIRNFTIIVILFSIFISALISFFISKIIFSPINEIKKLMKKVDHGNLDVSFKVKSNDEIGELGNSFNNMIGTIKQLIRSIEEKESGKRKAEIELLQAQINPHFLYNSLDNIKWLSEAKAFDKITLIATSLASFFRIGLSSGKDLIPVRDEIGHVQNYVSIVSLRYGSRINISCTICEEAFWSIIPKITFQPIVENSIMHGFKNSKNVLAISINGTIADNDVVFEIMDNGAGMDETKLDEIRNQLASKESVSGKHFGLRNVNQRLLHYFGEAYGIRIDSKQGSYTKVIVRIPLKEAGTNV